MIRAYAKFPVSSPKPRVLTFVSYYLPGFKAGGPPRSIRNLVRALNGDIEFSIVTRDRDLGDRESYQILRDAWIAYEHSRVNYRSPAARRLLTVARLLRDTPHDVLYLNSVFDVAFTAQPLLARRLGLAPARPLVIAPRGEFAPGAIAFKPALKASYILTAKIFGLFDDALWMASSPHEAEDIQRVLGISSERVIIASDIAGVPASENQGPPPRKSGDPLRIVFLARISPMKNLDYALKLLRDIDVPVNLDVFGPCSDEGYLRVCRRLAQDSPGHVSISFAGEVEPERVHDTLSRYDLMLLPTRGENFGHVILEALQVGTPVLTSDRTRWRSTVEGACLAVPLENPEEFRMVIRERATASGQEQARLRMAARLNAARFSDDPELVAANLSLFLRAAGRVKPLDAVVNCPDAG